MAFFLKSSLIAYPTKPLLRCTFTLLSDYTLPVILLSLNHRFSKCESWITYIRIAQGHLSQMWFLVPHLISLPQNFSLPQNLLGILTTLPNQSHGRLRTTVLTKWLSSWINFHSPESPSRSQFSRISSSSREWIKPSLFSSICQGPVSTLWGDLSLQPLVTTPTATTLSRPLSSLMGIIIPELSNSSGPQSMVLECILHHLAGGSFPKGACDVSFSAVFSPIGWAL